MKESLSRTHLRQLIVRDNQSLQYEKRPKCIRGMRKG